MPSPIQFYFDFLSPYAYLAHGRLGAVCSRFGAALAYHPVDLQQLKLAAGNTGPATREMPIKHRHLRIDLQRWATSYGVPLKPPSGYGSQRLNRGAFHAMDRTLGEPYVRTAWQLVWGEGGNMNGDDLMAEVSRRMGWNHGEFMDYVESSAAVERLETETQNASQLGVFGVPTMVIGDQMWWGNDRIHFLETHLQETENAAQP